MASLTTRAQVPDFDFREVEYGPYQTTFHLFAPADAKKVVVRIYKDGLGGKPLKTQKMTYEDGLWTAVVKGDLMGRFYTFDSRQVPGAHRALGHQAPEVAGCQCHPYPAFLRLWLS